LPIYTAEESVLFTVPKKTEIDRVACKEPEGNMLLQRSLGEVIRSKLRRYGIDLNDQSRNQRLAQSALKDGLATIDLSSASDLISRQLVFNLLPFDWWSILDDLRVKSTLLPSGEKHSLEMFSSMGNGYTFELESLLFLCLMLASREAEGCLNTRLSIFGDDMICHPKVADTLIPLLTVSGFTINKEKNLSCRALSGVLRA